MAPFLCTFIGVYAPGLRSATHYGNVSWAHLHLLLLRGCVYTPGDRISARTPPANNYCMHGMHRCKSYMTIEID